MQPVFIRTRSSLRNLLKRHPIHRFSTEKPFVPGEIEIRNPYTSYAKKVVLLSIPVLILTRCNFLRLPIDTSAVGIAGMAYVVPGAINIGWVVTGVTTFIYHDRLRNILKRKFPGLFEEIRIIELKLRGQYLSYDFSSVREENQQAPSKQERLDTYIETGDNQSYTSHQLEKIRSRQKIENAKSKTLYD